MLPTVLRNVGYVIAETIKFFLSFGLNKIQWSITLFHKSVKGAVALESAGTRPRSYDLGV